MRLIISLILIMMMAAGCYIIRPSVNTIHIEGNDSIKTPGLIYALPQTVLKITIDMLEIRTYRGPYYRFAEKYLGISGVPEENKSAWMIKNVTVSTFTEADPEQFYSITPVRGSFNPDNIMYLSNQGFIMDMSKLDAFTIESKKTNIFTRIPGILYTSPTVTRNIVQSTDTLYKTILADTAFIRIPVLKNEMISKTIDERAEEVADFIVELRTGRYELLTGQTDFYPEGPALEIALKRLDDLETEYMSLFIGKTIEIEHSLDFWYIPLPGEMFENIELFEYSDKNGISQKITGHGKTVNLLLSEVDKGKALDEFMKGKDKQNQSLIFYRIPDMAEAEIQDAGKTVFKERIPVYQYGTVLSMPVFR
jgi:Domain of unknown function (DUF4831)